MSFDYNWDESQPDGDAEDANQTDDWFKKLQINVRQRLEAFLGITDFAAQTPAAGIELRGTKLNMRGAAATGVIAGATSFAIRNNADSENNLLIEDDGDVTVRKDLAVLGALAVTGTITGGFILSAAYATSGTAPISGTNNVAFATEVIDTDAFHDNAVNNDRFTIPATKNGRYLVIAGAKAHCDLDLTGSNSTTLKIRKGNITDLHTMIAHLRDQGTGGDMFTEYPVVGMVLVDLIVGDFITLQYSGAVGTNGSQMTDFYLGLIRIG